jgi:hypothetical protein
MQPEFSNKYDRLIRYSLIVLVVTGLVFLGYQLYLSRHFRVVSTNPRTRSVATISPFLKINFNRQLSSKNLSISSSYAVVSSYKIQNKTLIVNLKVPMTAGYKYYVKINGVSDNKGDRLVNKVFNFTPKKISSKNLPEDQKQALLKTQSQRPRSKNSIVFTGINSLINVGVSATQANNLEQDFFDFAPQTNTVSLSSVAPVPHDPNSSSTNDSINFKALIGSKSYDAKIDYSNLNDFLRLTLYSPQDGSQVYDSSVVKGGKEGGVD